jgi:hypothetical protein
VSFNGLRFLQAVKRNSFYYDALAAKENAILGQFVLG